MNNISQMHQYKLREHVNQVYSVWSIGIVEPIMTEELRHFDSWFED